MADVKRIDLALQGGGSHGAFTWGVLDRLLDDERLEIAGVSGTSAGAMNATVLAAGMQTGGRKGAQETLRNFWRAISNAALFSPIQRTPLDRLLGRWSLDWSPSYVWFDNLSRAVSPYTLNPLNINPLLQVLEDTVDFARLRTLESPKVFIAATSVNSGQERIFRNEELTPQMVLASACLPFMYQAVEIEGEGYWDGGYMGNPVLYPLLLETDVNDLLIVQINPFYRPEIPKTAADILNRLNEITFNASLIKELRSLALLQVLFDNEDAKAVKVREMMLHLIASEEMTKLNVSSKMNAEWAFLMHLHDIGWRTAEAWLATNFDHIGTQSTFDIAELNTIYRPH